MSADIRAELMRLTHLPPWDRVQHDEWDVYSDFIYTTYSLDQLRREIRRAAEALVLPLQPFASYAVRRWYNFHTHQVVLEMFCAHPPRPPGGRSPTSVGGFLRRRYPL